MGVWHWVITTAGWVTFLGVAVWAGLRVRGPMLSSATLRTQQRLLVLLWAVAGTQVCLGVLFDWPVATTLLWGGCLVGVMATAIYLQRAVAATRRVERLRAQNAALRAQAELLQSQAAAVRSSSDSREVRIRRQRPPGPDS
jgi:hypothetical protein